MRQTEFIQDNEGTPHTFFYRHFTGINNYCGFQRIIPIIILLCCMTVGCLLPHQVNMTADADSSRPMPTAAGTQHLIPISCETLAAYLPRPPAPWEPDNSWSPDPDHVDRRTGSESDVSTRWKYDGNSVVVSITDHGSYDVYGRIDPRLQRITVKGYPGILTNTPPPGTKRDYYTKEAVIKDRIIVRVSSSQMNNIDQFISLIDFEGIGALI